MKRIESRLNTASAEFQANAGVSSSDVPEFLWQSADDVALAALAAYDRGRVSVVWRWRVGGEGREGGRASFLVARQLVAPARALAGGPEGVLEVLRCRRGGQRGASCVPILRPQYRNSMSSSPLWRC